MGNFEITISSPVPLRGTIVGFFQVVRYLNVFGADVISPGEYLYSKLRVMVGRMLEIRLVEDG